MNLGKVVKIQGGVVDVAFANAAPQIQELLYAGDIPLEVMLMRDQGVARCMALAPVRGLGLGTEVKATGAPIKVPVGEGVLGRMLNVFGEPIDGLPALDHLEKRSIHQNAPALSERSMQGAVLETGIKALDLLSPIERGGNVEAVKLLAKTKKGLNAAEENGWTALHLCAINLKNGNRNHDGEIVKILLANGALIDKVNKKGRTALILSALNERPEVLRILLANKANVNTVDHSGYTANSYAVEGKKWGLSALLQGITAQQARENSLYPAQPAQRAGVVTCNTRCLNGDCYRTYGDGRKVRFQAQQKYNPVSGNWEYDSGTCN